MLFSEVLDCQGRFFPREWGSLYGQLLDAASAPLLAAAAVDGLIARWQNHSVPGCGVLPQVLLGEASVRELRGFCPYGYIAALLHASSAASGRRAALVDDAVACAIHGGQWWPWDFLRESRWAAFVRPAEVFHQRDHARGGGTSAPRGGAGRRHLHRVPHCSYEAPPIPSAQAVPPSFWERLRFTDPVRASKDQYLVPYQTQLTAALGALMPAAPAPKKPGARTISFAAFGVHLTTLLEPVSAFRRVIPPSVPSVNVILYGSTHPPPQHILQEVCPMDQGAGSPASFRCFVSTAQSDSFWQALVDRPVVKDALGALAGALAGDRAMQEADCLICGGGHSPTLCLLLRMVTDKPMYFTLQAPLTFRMPRQEDQRALLVAFFREMVGPLTPRPSRPGSEQRGHTVVSTSLIFFQRQVWMQTGRLLPVVRNHNWYVAASPRVVSEASAAAPLRSNEVLFWQNHVSLKADCAMTIWRLMKQTVLQDFPFRFVFKNLRNLPSARPGRMVYALRGEEAAMLSYADLQERFAAAILFPHDLGMISFDDLYALGIPLFMPENDLVAAMAYAQLESTKNYPWYLVREEHAELRYARIDKNGRLPWNPGWGGADVLANGTSAAAYLGHDMIDMSKLLQAVETSNFVLFPHVRRFLSLAALLRELMGLRAGELEAISAAMRRFAAAAWEVTSGFYRRAALHLLGLGTEA